MVGLAELGTAYPSQLSGGQRQRVGIARALAGDPDVLLCDEPTSALDPATTDEILDLIKDLTVRLQLTVLIITHEMNVVKRVCDAVSLLESGRIVEHGSLAEIAEHADSRLAQALLPLPQLSAENQGFEDGQEETVLDLTFGPGNANRPVLSGLARHFDIDVNVISGSVESLGSEQFGRLRVALGPGTDRAAVVRYLEESGVSVNRPVPNSEQDSSEKGAQA